VLVQERLAACVNVMKAPVLSMYRWKGKIESTKEYLLLIKTARRLLGRARASVARLHSYEVPEFIALAISAGAPRYLQWLDECLATPAPKLGRGRR
jgi:periplasmic divalent cation tolerance protein